MCLLSNRLYDTMIRSPLMNKGVKKSKKRFGYNTFFGYNCSEIKSINGKTVFFSGQLAQKQQDRLQTIPV